MDGLGIIEKPFKNVSYLCARDPSILTWGLASNLKNIREDLGPRLGEETANVTDLAEYCTEGENQLQVYLRLKKSEDFKSLYEIVNNKSLLCKVPEGAHCIRNVRDGSAVTKVFEFSKIFGPESQQADLFNNVIKAKVLRFINGLNSSLLTYGASGSGKTFTIIGTSEHPGIVPRALEYMFRTLPKLPEQPQYKPTIGGGIKKLTDFDCSIARSERLNIINNLMGNFERCQHVRTYRAMQERLSEEPVALITEDISHVNLSIWVSFAEIYNESVFDLLKCEPARGVQRQKLRLGNCNGATYIKDLTCVNVSSGLDAYHILQYGLQNLKYAATNLNDHSSRSHSVFTIKLTQASSTQGGVCVSYFNFCDLAGSERIRKTNHVGDRLKESNNINRSLLILGRCISLVREAQKRKENIPIPFRESKLTQLFQVALQGLESISMIVNINPTRDMFDESQHVLNFSAVAKDVIIEKQQRVEVLKSRISNKLLRSEENGVNNDELFKQIESLLDEIEQQKLDHEEDRENLKSSYNKIIDNTRTYWEKRVQELEDQLTKHITEQASNSEPEPKKRKLSLIVIDSSDDEGESHGTSRNLKQINIELNAQLESKEAQLASSEAEVNKIKEQYKSLEQQIIEMDSEIFKLREQNTELNDYILATQQSKSEVIDEKENTNLNHT